MAKKILYAVMFLFLLSHFSYLLPAGQIKLVKRINLDELEILKPAFIKVNQENIYIYDEASMAFFIINSDFKLKKKFGNPGIGPGEYQKPILFGFLNNRLWVLDSLKKMIWYNITGEYIEEKKLADQQSLILDQIDTDQYYVLDNQFDKNGDRVKNLIFISGSKKKNLAEIKEKLHSTLDLESKTDFLFTTTKNLGYVVPSNKQYFIRIFDIKKMVVSGEIEKKNYRKIKYNQKEISELNERVKKILLANPFLQQFKITLPILKPAIDQVYSDEMDRLYVISPTSEEGKNFLEIYDKTLKYQDGYYIPKTRLFFPTPGFIYLVNLDEKEETFWLQIFCIS